MAQSYDNNSTGDAYVRPFAAPTTPDGKNHGYASINVQRLGLSNNLTDPLRNFKFLVNINHRPSGILGPTLTQGIGFMSVSGLAATTEAIPYREGGMNTTVHQLPGQTSFSPITLQRGVTLGGNSNGSWQWFRQLFDVVGGQGTGPAFGRAGNRFRTDMTIDVLEHPVTLLDNDPDGSNLIIPVKFRVKVYNAWITGISFSDLNAGDNAVMVEQMTLVHEGFRVNYASPTANGSANTNV